MIYLDYSATTPVSKEVVDIYSKICLDYIGNPNSSHEEGFKSHQLMENSVNFVASSFGVTSENVIFTSGATESNNLAIKGVALNKKKGHIITTKLEHSSVSETVKYLVREGFEVDYVNVDSNGIVNIDNLNELIREDTILVTICMVNSEVGVLNPVNEIGKILKEKNIIFHVDGTQAVGKVNVDLTNIDLFSFSAQKFYGMKGVGVLINKGITLVPLIHGGKSQSDLRAGTPPLPLIVSLSKALGTALVDLDKRYDYVKSLNEKIVNKLNSYEGIVINSNEYCVPHILNVSLLNIKPETFVNAMSSEGIYLSTQSACSRKNDTSKTLLAMGKDRDTILGAIRISLSYKTTIEEVDEFLAIFDKIYTKLNNLFKGE